MTLAVYHCGTMQKIEIHKFRMTVRNGKMAVALLVNISISHSISDAESVPVESNCEPENVKVKVSFVNF